MALVKTKNGTMELWDAGARAVVKDLDKNCEVDEVVFSPDDKIVVTVTRDKKQAMRSRGFGCGRWRPGNVCGNFCHTSRKGTRK